MTSTVLRVLGVATALGGLVALGVGVDPVRALVVIAAGLVFTHAAQSRW